MDEIRTKMCRLHMNGIVLSKKILHLGYYRQNLEQDLYPVCIGNVIGILYTLTLSCASLLVMQRGSAIATLDLEDRHSR